MKALLTLIIFLLIIATITTINAAEFKYITKEPTFPKIPLVCIFEPNEPLARQVIKDEWMKQTENGIKAWQYALMEGEDRKRDMWRIDIIKIPIGKEKSFDTSYCDVEVKFTGSQNPNHPGWLGWEYFDGKKSQIRIFYMSKEICGHKYDPDLGYSKPQFCYKDDFQRSGAIGNIATHEFGHSLGLGHFESSSSRQNYLWSIDPIASPSIMTIAIHYNEELNQIRQVDVEKVKERYQNRGFGKFVPIPEFKEEIIQESEFPILNTTNYIIPEWIKRNAKFWSEDRVEKSAFVEGIQFLADERIIKITQVTESEISRNMQIRDESIPDWLKTTAIWWADNHIQDQEFINSIEFLIEKRIIITN